MADDSYEIGFRKPPKHTQFQKGRSGNPKGRPRGSKNVPALIREIFEATITVKGPGGNLSVTKLEAGLIQLANKAATGDLKAIKEVVRLAKEMSEPECHPQVAPVFQVNFIKPESYDSK